MRNRFASKRSVKRNKPVKGPKIKLFNIQSVLKTEKGNNKARHSRGNLFFLIYASTKHRNDAVM